MEDVAVGLTIFFIGLFKKVILADGVSSYVGPVFDHTGAPDLSHLGLRALLTRSRSIRFFRLFRHGDWTIAPLRRCPAAELCLALQSEKHHRVLALLAHDVVALLTRLPLHSAWRQSQRVGAPVRQLDDDDAARWAVARRWLDLHHLERTTRSLSRGEPSLAEFTRGRRARGKGSAIVAQTFTFLCVVVAWVFFRAPTLPRRTSNPQRHDRPERIILPLPQSVQVGEVCRIVALLLIVFLCPNTQEIMRNWQPKLVQPLAKPGLFGRLAWTPNAAWGIATAVLAVWSLVAIRSITANFSTSASDS